MVLVGLSWLVCWLLVQVFSVEIVKAILTTGIIFLIVGLLYDHTPWIRKT